MHQYGITHKTGNYQLILIEMEAGVSAHIFDAKNNCVAVLHANTEDAAYDACLKWASANIRGEFFVNMNHVSGLSPEINAFA